MPSDAELVRVDQQVAVRGDQDVLGMIAAAARDPQVDIAKMERLMDLHQRLVAEHAKVAFIQAMARLQPKLPRITKHGVGVHDTPFAKYEDMDAAIRPLYCAEGFTIEFLDPKTTERGELELTMKTSHVEGHTELSTINLPRDSSGAKNTTQGVGSTISYGKRYLLAAKFNIITVDQDDDGQGDKPLTEDQLRQVMDLVVDRGADQVKFLQFMRVSKFEEISQRELPRALNALRSKVKR